MVKYFIAALLISVACTQVTNKKTSANKEIEAIEFPVADTLILLFGGDAMQHLPQINSARTDAGYDYTSCLAPVKNIISQADISIINFETTLGDKPYTGYPQFSSPDEFAKALKECGFDIFLTANNHCLDRYTQGAQRTLNQLDSLSITHIGTYRNSVERQHNYPMIKTVNNIHIAFLNYTYGKNGISPQVPFVVNLIDTLLIKQDINSARNKGAELLIACMHWGDEYHRYPNKNQKILANWLEKNGVQLIIGSHPHVVQPIELHTDSAGSAQSLVAYSLGNFVSNMQKRYCDGGIMLKVKICKEHEQIRIISAGYILHFTRRPAHGAGPGYEILPLTHITEKKDSIPQHLWTSISRFVSDTRSLMEQYSFGVKEITN